MLQQQEGAEGQWISVVGNLPPDVTSYDLAFLKDGTDYYYRLRSWNEFGYSPWSDVVQVTTQADTRLRAVFQQDVDGYQGTQDLEIAESNPDVARGEQGEISCDGNVRAPTPQEQQVLVRFDDLFGEAAGQVPPGATITLAEFRVYTTSSTDDASGGIWMHQMLVPWTEVDTWNTMVEGVQIDDVEAASAPAAYDNFLNSNEYSTWDVTSLVKAWQVGEANHGWVFINTGDDGWDFFTSEYASDSDPGYLGKRPMLTVFYE
jgi:hypothetical protein